MSDPTNPTNPWESAANDAIDAAKNAANNTVDSAENVANNAIDSAENVANNAIDSAESVANNAIDSAKNVATNAVESAKAVVDKAKEVVNALGGNASSLPSLGGGGGVTSLVAAAAGGGALGAIAGGLGGGNALASFRAPSVSRSLATLGGSTGASPAKSVKLEKAAIYNIDASETTPVVTCLYNPKEFTISKQNKWSPGKNIEESLYHYEFAGGDPLVLKVQLFFDTTHNGSDVKKETDKVLGLMVVDPNLANTKTKKGRPPRVYLGWGTLKLFESVITSVSQKFTLFDVDGTPLRATLDVSFQQISDPGVLPKQNPTSGGDGGEQLWSVKTGDTLAWISYKVYGDSTRWRLIAEANRLLNVRRLTPGMILVIPNA